MLGTAINLGSFLLDVVSKLNPNSEEITSAAKVAERARLSYNVVSTHSVHQSAQRGIIAPMTCIEQTLIHQEFMSDLMQIVMLRDVVATLTHLSFQNAIGVGIKVENVIGSINPKRAGMMSLLGAEAFNDNVRPAGVVREEKPGPDAGTVMIGDKPFLDLNEYTPLAVGKVVKATIFGENGQKVEFPLTFRAIPMPLPVKDMERVFSAAKIEDGLSVRVLMVKTGELTSHEFLTGKDIVKQKFKIRNEEMSGYYKEALKRDVGNKVTAIRTGVLSLNTLANAFIMSSDTALRLELEIGKRFNDPISREKIFQSIKANTIVVVNQDRGIFTFYTHGSDLPEVYTRKDIAIKSKKDTGSNTLEDLVKLLNGGA